MQFLRKSPLRQVAGRFSWGIADQAVSSLRSFLLGVFVARSFGAEGLGVLGLGLVAIVFTLNASRALSTDPLMIRYSGVADDKWRRAAAAGTGVALLVGLTAGMICLALGVLLTFSEVRTEIAVAFLALSIALPGLAVQDSWRYAFFAHGQGRKTFVNDVIWAVLLAGVLYVGDLAGASGIAWPLLAFGATGSLTGVAGMLQARMLPDPMAASKWLREHRDLGPRFLVENLMLASGGQIRPLAVAAVASLAAVGAIRGAEMLIGPIVMLLMGVAQVAVPESTRALARGPRFLHRLCLAVSVGLSLIALCWGAMVLVALPLGLGDVLLGDVWRDAYPLVFGVVVSAAAGCLHVGPSAGLRSLGRADVTMRCQLIVSALFIVLAVVGAALDGAQGAVWGTAAGAMIGAAIWWREFSRVRRQCYPLGDQITTGHRGPPGRGAARRESTRSQAPAQHGRGGKRAGTTLRDENGAAAQSVPREPIDPLPVQRPRDASER